ncbi:septum formation initiator family protein [Gemella morbillorum]|uniref:FtsB family cell division protein n=1 Tax=Gemella morbillorum TaxID=29391 RepID=UPI0028D8A940|nr:septum formation initiator family protein [Gemella morbillorum]
MATQNNQFRKDVLKAKAKYRKRRKLLILSVMSMVLAVTLIQTYMYIREKKQISNQLTEQNNTIEKLDKENKVNELVIDKLKDPYFITDLVRQEYGLSYQGEIIFNLPLQESFLQTTIKSIMDGDLQKVEDNHGRIDDSKIPELSKNNNDKKTSSGKDNKSKNKDTDNEDEKNTSEQNTTRQTTNPNTTNQRGNRG